MPQQSLQQRVQLEDERAALPASEERRRSVVDQELQTLVRIRELRPASETASEAVQQQVLQQRMAVPGLEEEFVAEVRALERPARMQPTPRGCWTAAQ